ncbi:MAG: MopE-related protein [Candidatus Woesearchaeota archaeon]
MNKKILASVLLFLIVLFPVSASYSPLLDNEGEVYHCSDDSQCSEGYYCSRNFDLFLDANACCPSADGIYTKYDFQKKTCLTDCLDTASSGCEYSEESEDDTGEGWGTVEIGTDRGVDSDYSQPEEDTSLGERITSLGDSMRSCEVVIASSCQFGSCDRSDYNCDGIKDEICSATQEICYNGIDEDKDGVADDGCSSVERCETCGEGWGYCDQKECLSLGLCQFDDGWIWNNKCTRLDNKEKCIPEVCNGVDDDCDGVVDNDCLKKNSKISREYTCYAWEACAGDSCVVEFPNKDQDGDGVLTKVELRYWANPLVKADDPYNRMMQRGCPGYFRPETGQYTQYSGPVNLGAGYVLITSISKISANVVGDTVGLPHGIIGGVWSDVSGLAELVWMLGKLALDFGAKNIEIILSCGGENVCVLTQLSYSAAEGSSALIQGVIQANYKEMYHDAKNSWFDKRSTFARKIWDYEEECNDVILTRTYTSSYSAGFIAAQVALLVIPITEVSKLSKIKFLLKFKGMGGAYSRGAKLIDAAGEFTWLSKLPDAEAQKVAKLIGEVAETYGDDVARKIAKGDIGKEIITNWNDEAIEGLAKYLDETGTDLNTVFRGLSTSEIDLIGWKLNGISKDITSDGVVKLLKKDNANLYLLIGKKDTLIKWVNEGEDIIGTKHFSVKPSQNAVDPEVIESYFQKLIKGEKIDEPIDIIIVEGKGRFIDDGHHRYIAYKKAGYKYHEMLINEDYDYSFRGYNNWEHVSYSDFSID